VVPSRHPERKTAEEAMAQRQMTGSRRMFTSSPLATSAFPPAREGRFLAVNDAWVKMYERSA